MEQLELGLAEAYATQHFLDPDLERFRGYATLNWRPRGSRKLYQEVFPVEKMAWFVGQALKYRSDGHDLYIAQHSYRERQRQTSSLLSLNVGHIDLDTYRSKFAGDTPENVISAVLKTLEAKRIPSPSWIVATGRGLQVKWTFTTPLLSYALPRWQACHRHLVEILAAFGADGKAILPTQIMRLVGSVNQKSGAGVRIAWVNGSIHDPALVDFDDWCTAVLPFSRLEVRAFKERMRRFRRWSAENKANRELLMQTYAARAQQRAAAWRLVGKAIGMEFDPYRLAGMDDLLAGEVWQGRLKVMDHLLEIRGWERGVPPGERNNWLWIAANGMAWVNREQKTAASLLCDVRGYAQKYIPTFDEREIISASASVVSRFTQEQGIATGLYRMRESTFREKLGISDSETSMISLYHDIGRLFKKGGEEKEKQNVGIMGFPKMHGLSFDEYQRETTRRRQAAGKRSASLRRQGSEEKRATAHLMSSRGISAAQISRELGSSYAAVRTWLATKPKC